MFRLIRHLTVVAALVLAVPIFQNVGAVPSYTVIDLGDLGGSGSDGRDINESGQVTGQAYCPGVCYHAFRYSSAPMTDLGTLEAPPAFVNGSWGEAINASGQVAGTSYLSNFSVRAFRYTDGVGMIDLGTIPGGTSSRAYALNNAGQVTGEATNATGTERAFLYTDGAGMIEIHDPALGFPKSHGLSINSSGHVVGGVWGGSNFFNAGFLYSNGVITLLTPNGGYAYAINDAGQITGTAGTPPNGAESHAFIYQNGILTDIAPGWPLSVGLDINANGGVAGIIVTANFDQHAFRYSNGIATDLGTFGGTESRANDINAAGHVTGYAYTAGGGKHAFLYRNSSEGLLDLNTLIPTSSGWILHEGTAINNLGQITGVGQINGEFHAFLLVPATTVQPSTIAKTFQNSTITLGASTSLTFTLGNPNGTPLTGVSFSDPFPAGMMVGTGAITNSCGGSVTGAPGAASISLSGGSLLANAQCAIVVPITGITVGTWTNVTLAVSSTEGGTGGTATASLTVQSSQANCHGQVTSGYAKQYGGLRNAAAALGFSSVQLLQEAIRAACGK